jgi:hypothetical protein
MSQGYSSITSPPVGVSGNQLVVLINTNTAALITKHSGTTAPTSPQTFQDWMDTSTTPYTYKIWDGADWIVHGYLDATNNQFLVSYVGKRDIVLTSGSLASTDREKLVTFSNASATAISLAQAGTSFPDGWRVYLRNKGAGLVTITATTSTIDGVATLTLAQNQSAILISDGTNYYTASKSSGVATTAAPGLAQFADQTATDTGSSSSLALTPAGLAGWNPTSNPRLDPISNTVSDSSGTITIDLANGDNFDTQLTSTGRTLANPSNMRAGAVICLKIAMDATGSRTITTYGSFWKFTTTPVLDGTANAVQYIIGYCESTTIIRAVFKSGWF